MMISAYVFLVLAVVAADLPARTTANEAAESGHHRRLALPLRSAMEVYASSKGDGGDDNEGERSPVSDLTAPDYGDTEAIVDDDRFSAAAVERRGFRLGGRDRFSHGFGRKRSEENIELAALRPDLTGR